MAESIEALVNPKLLLWARMKSGFDTIGVAKKIGVKSEQIESWETGEKHPTICQAMNLAKVYNRPLSVFYLNETPKDFSVAMRDYRRVQEVSTPTLSPGLMLEQRLAESRRNIVVELVESDDDGIFPFLNSISLSDSPELIAEKVRHLLRIDWNIQRKWHDPNEALNSWKDAIEHLNVLVFHTNPQGISFEPEEARGFSVSASRFPFIVINSKDSQGARIFTLLHEFVHLLLDAGGICDLFESPNTDSFEQRIEVFCNRVAGEILVPTSLLLAHEVVRLHSEQSEWDVVELSELASAFRASEDAILRRLLTLKMTSQEFYNRKHIEYTERWVEFKKQRKGGGAPPYHRLILRKNGKLYTRQIFSAYYDRQITLSDVTELIGVKVKFLKNMEREAFTNIIGA